MDTRTMFGRRVITTDVAEITAENVVDVLREAMSVHELNRSEIEYLLAVPQIMPHSTTSWSRAGLSTRNIYSFSTPMPLVTASSLLLPTYWIGSPQR